MNEHQFGNKVRQHLNHGLRLEAGIAARLKAARERALARQRPQAAGGLAWADNVVASLGGWSGISLRIVLPSVLLAAALLAINNWQQNQRVAEVEEIDALLLTDDLPPEAYLDRGFQNWLKKRSSTEQ